MKGISNRGCITFIFLAAFLFIGSLSSQTVYAAPADDDKFSWSLALPAFMTGNNTITPSGSLTVISPNGGETVARGTSMTITWKSNNVIGNVTIQIYYGNTALETFTNVANSGNYTWNLGNDGVTGDTFKVLILNTTSGSKIFDYSDASFSITPYVLQCDSTHLNLCNSSNCSSAGGYWYNSTCNLTPPNPPEGVVWYKNRFWQKEGSTIPYNAADAVEYCEITTTGGYSDWQLPTKDELKNLVYCDNGAQIPLEDGKTCGSGFTSPTIDSEFESRNESYWTQTVDSGGTWTVNFLFGDADPRLTSNSFYARCIRKQ